MNRSESVSPGSAAVETRKHSMWLVIGDLVTCCAAMGVLFLHCLFRSPRKLFWSDEVLTELAVRNASFSETLAALRDTINAMPPGYFTGLWLWSKAFGTSDFALRAFSSLAMGCAWILCWLLLRQFCSRLTAIVATTTAMACSPDILFFNVEARCYAQYLAAFLAAGLLFVLSFRRPQAPALRSLRPRSWPTRCLSRRTTSDASTARH